MSGTAPVETGNERIPLWMVAFGATVALLGVVSSPSPSRAPPGPVGAGPAVLRRAVPGEAVRRPVGRRRWRAPRAGTADAATLIERAGCQACPARTCPARDLSQPPRHRGGPKSEISSSWRGFPRHLAHPVDRRSGPEVAGLDPWGMPAFGGPTGSSRLTESGPSYEYLLTSMTDPGVGTPGAERAPVSADRRGETRWQPLTRRRRSWPDPGFPHGKRGATVRSEVAFTELVRLAEPVVGPGVR